MSQLAGWRGDLYLILMIAKPRGVAVATSSRLSAAGSNFVLSDAPPVQAFT